MTAQSHPAPLGARPRPAPPRPAGAPAPPSAPPEAAVAALATAITYVPEEYDVGQATATPTASAGQFGAVYPKQTTRGGAWLVLLVIVAAVAGFGAWRVVRHTAATPPPGIAYASPAGHFSARFPAQPVEVTRSVRNGRLRLVVHLAVVPGQASAGELEVSGPLSGDSGRLGQRLAQSVGSTGQITLSGVKKFTFAGRPAQQGNYIQPTSGELMTMLVVVASPRRIYLVLGLTGSTFDVLKDSFHVMS